MVSTGSAAHSPSMLVTWSLASTLSELSGFSVIVAACMGDVKVLIAGSVGGKIKDLYKRVAAVNNSNGPFDLLVCTGDFFGTYMLIYSSCCNAWSSAP